MNASICISHINKNIHNNDIQYKEFANQSSPLAQTPADVCLCSCQNTSFLVTIDFFVNCVSLVPLFYSNHDLVS